VHMLHTALRYDDGPIAPALPPRRGRRGWRCRGGPRRSRSATGGGSSGGRGGGAGEGHGRRCSATAAASPRRWRRPTSWPTAAISVTVARTRASPKPIDAGLAAQLAAEHRLLVTVEEGVLAGGFGSAVWETLSDAGVAVGGARILRVGLPDAYITHGTPALLHEEVGFTGRRIAERVEAAVAERSGVGLRGARSALRGGLPWSRVEGRKTAAGEGVGFRCRSGEGKRPCHSAAL